MSKHTPGPWRLKRATHFTQNDLKEYYWVGFGPVGDETPIFKRDLTENEANARLIAAAPDLLRFVEFTLAEQIAHGESGDAQLISVARELIARAAGGSND